MHKEPGDEIFYFSSLLIYFGQERGKGVICQSSPFLNAYSCFSVQQWLLTLPLDSQYPHLGLLWNRSKSSGQGNFPRVYTQSQVRLRASSSCPWQCSQSSVTSCSSFPPKQMCEVGTCHRFTCCRRPWIL